MSGKVDSATGVISVAVFGVQAALSPGDLAAWMEVIVNCAPAILILFLIWRIHKLDKLHANCTNQWAKTQEQLALAYRAITDSVVRDQLPKEQEFLSCNFDLHSLGGKDNDR